MKLNLLPSHVAKSQGSKGAFFVMILIIAFAGAATFVLINTGRGKLEAARDRADELRPKVAIAMGNSQMADQVIQRVTGIDRNLKLTAAMTEHNTKYVALYQDVMSHIPSFYRINSLAAAPSGPDSCTVQMTGVLKTHKQYADLVAALYRMPGVVSVARNGYNDVSPYVPNLNTGDQIGTPIKPGEANLPSDPDLRMQEMIRRANSGPTGFQHRRVRTRRLPEGRHARLVHGQRDPPDRRAADAGPEPAGYARPARGRRGRHGPAGQQHRIQRPPSGARQVRGKDYVQAQRLGMARGRDLHRSRDRQLRLLPVLRPGLAGGRHGQPLRRQAQR
jgi:hypothetical protein